MKSYLIAAVLSLLASGVVTAQDRETPVSPTEQTARDQVPAREEGEKSAVSGLKLGAGVGVTFDFGGLERVNEAELVNGIVRVTDEDDVIAGFVGEAHYFFPSSGELFGVAKENWGHGPFFALQTGEKDIIATVALGWMIGFRPANSSESFNIGLGVAVAPNVRTLGDDIVRNEPLPAGETAIRYREEAQYGLMLLFSRSF